MATYLEAREELLNAELTLMQQREAVAALRRELPQGPVAKDYVFGSSGAAVRLADLISQPDRSLIVYHFMFGGPQTEPCPMCAMWADGWNGVNGHISATADFVLVTNATVSENEQLAAQYGWQQLTWLSAADNTFKRDYGSADADGNQQPVVTVFERDHDDEDTVRLAYSGSAHITGEHGRGVDLLSPVWHLLDLTRPGRGDFMPQLAQ